MATVKMFLLALLALSATAQQQVAMQGSSSSAIPDSCVTNPLQSNCTQFSYPTENAAADLARLCNAMHFMASCSVAKACNASGAGPDDPTGPGASKVSANNPNICSPFNQVATICTLDTGMSRMMGCNNYNSMCVAGSKVPVCSTQKGLIDIPKSETVNSQVRSICEEMTMDGCELCMPSWQAGKKWADCDLLDVYGLLCYQMPEMGQCSDWHKMCKADSSLIFCHGAGGDSGSSGGGSSTAGPVMKMYFFEELPFYLLFKQWTPQTNGDLAGAWVAIFSLGLLYELLQMVYGNYEAKFWARYNAGAAAAVAARDVEYGRPLVDGVENGSVKTVANGDGGQPCKGCCSGSATTMDIASPNVQFVSSTKECCSSASGGFAGNSYKAPAAPKSNKGCCRAYFQLELVVMDLTRGAARFVLAGLAYLLMLAAMSYHVAIFFAVIAGVGVGSMLFGRWRFSTGTAEGYSHCGCGSS